jgi:hypothetical protein
VFFQWLAKTGGQRKKVTEIRALWIGISIDAGGLCGKNWGEVQVELLQNRRAFRFGSNGVVLQQIASARDQASLARNGI